MFRLIFAFIILLVFATEVDAKITLSNHAHVSVLTCSQGEELYSAFGHSAIRVVDTENNIDLVFNYGTFDFSTPNFYLKFANGKLNYMLAVGKFERFLPEYYRDKRSVVEQILNISASDKQAVFDALIKNYEPENRYYKYDFFYDNCATRIFDIINDNIEGDLILNSDSSKNSDKTFREYLHYYLWNSPWIETGLNTILGLPTDKVTTLRESTFLPFFLMNIVDHSTIKEQGKSSPMVSKTVNLLEFDLNEDSSFSIFDPLWIFSLLLLLIVVWSFYFRRFKLFNSILDRLLFVVVGIIGLIISYLWFISDLQATGTNLNLIWAFPTFIYLAFSKWKTTFSVWLLKMHFIILSLFVLGWYWIPQSFPASTIPVSIILAIRIVIIIKQKQIN